MHLNLLLCLFALAIGFSEGGIPTSLPLDDLILPDGFVIEVIADNATHDIIAPRAMHVEQYNGATLIYLGSVDFDGKAVKVLIDRDSDNTIDDVYTVFEGDSWPIASLAIDPMSGELYMSQVNMTYHCIGNANEQVLAFNSDNDRLRCEEWFYVDYNSTYWAHALHYMSFNHEGNICIAFGQNCNECHTTPPKSTIQCFGANNDLNGQVWAAGIRNSFGFDFHPVTGKMWFTDNGRDQLLNHTNMPDDELNYVAFRGQFFGYPNCHSVGHGDPEDRDINSVKAVIDPFIGPGLTKNCTEGVTLAKQPLGPHVAAVGMKFYSKNMFPKQYNNSIFVAEHGSWDRTPKIGYRVANVKISGNDTVTAHDVFAQGWLNKTANNEWGRPNSLAILPDGSLLVSDDIANSIYRIYYDSSRDTTTGVSDNPFDP